jgi:hypothetical protein
VLQKSDPRIPAAPAAVFRSPEDRVSENTRLIVLGFRGYPDSPQEQIALPALNAGLIIVGGESGGGGMSTIII